MSFFTRITTKVNAIAAGSSITPNCDNTDVVTYTPNQPFTINNPTGTPDDYQLLVFRITNTTHSVTWGSAYRGSTDLPLPSLSSNKTDYFGFRWNATNSKWDYVAENRGF